MEETNDGFKISEKDLKIRGPGGFGRPDSMDFLTKRAS